MKKSLSAILVIFFTLVGATALAAQFDSNVRKNIIESSDKGGGSNGTGGRNAITKEK